MTERSPRAFLGIKPKQAVILAGLVGVLAFLIFSQDDGASDPLAEGDAAIAETASARPPTNQKPTDAEPKTWIPKWPEVELEQMLALDPFAPLANPASEAVTQTIPAASIKQATDSGEESDSATDQPKEKDSVTELQSFGVSMIFRNRQKVCALIGDRVVREGDVIDGMRVVAITSTEVVFEPAGPSE